MTVEDLKSFYKAKNQSHLAKLMLCGRSTITKWKKDGIPSKTQASIQVGTNGKLKADIDPLSA